MTDALRLAVFFSESDMANREHVEIVKPSNERNESDGQ